jgi:hypothetical protein
MYNFAEFKSYSLGNLIGFASQEMNSNNYYK